MNTLTKTLIGILFVVLCGCQEYGVQVRIENTSQVDFDRISINNVSFGPLKSNEISEYLPFENIYSSEFIEVLIGDQTLKVIPEDFDPNDYYDTGNYKYVIDVLHKKWLSVRFEEE